LLDPSQSDKPPALTTAVLPALRKPFAARANVAVCHAHVAHTAQRPRFRWKTNRRQAGDRFWGQSAGLSGPLGATRDPSSPPARIPAFAGRAPCRAGYQDAAAATRSLHGKEGVDGSSPSEGSAKGPQIGLSLSDQLARSAVRCGYGALYGGPRFRTAVPTPSAAPQALLPAGLTILLLRICRERLEPTEWPPRYSRARIARARRWTKTKRDRLERRRLRERAKGSG